MRIGLLGPLTLSFDGVPVAPPAPRTRRALIFLALHAGHVVRPDRLADAVWPDDPPANVVRAVHSLVYRLRHQLPVEAAAALPVVWHAPGYALDVDRAEIDVHVFEARLDTAHEALATEAAAAREQFEAALDLWRGEPLLDVADDPWALAESRRLEERYVAAREALALCDVELGNHQRAIAELTGLSVSFPLRESVWALLWRALAATDRYTEVIESHRRCSQLLREEYDIELSAHLRDVAVVCSAPPRAPARRRGGRALPNQPSSRPSDLGHRSRAAYWASLAP